MKTCLIIDKMHPSITEMLGEAGWKGDYQPSITREELLKITSGYEGIIFRSKTKIDKEVLEKAVKLKFLGRAGAGLDMIDLDEARRRNIPIINAPEGNRDAVAEHAIGMLLVLFNKINIADKEVRQLKWDREGNRGVELSGKTVALIGYGYMGEAIATRLSSFGCTILAYDKYKDGFSNEFVKGVSMEEIFDSADILSLHIPLTKETKYMIDDTYINSFKKSFYFVNTARGEIVKLAVLKKAIESGKILGAALDVLENEKLNTLTPEQQNAFNYLAASDKVILTPHVAGWTEESYVKINKVLVEKLKGLGL